MIDGSSGIAYAKNVNSPFTEIFSLLTKYELLPDNTCELAYTPAELIILRQHMENASEMILQGLQDVGALMAAVDKEKMKQIPVDSIGCFISAVCNLIEAMSGFNR